MKLRGSHCKAAALTLIETLVVILMLLLLAVLLLPALAAAKKKSSKIGCSNNLKQDGLAFRIWSGDNFDKFPMAVSVTNGGAMELATKGDAISVFQVMSNELSTPRVLCCPNDPEISWPTNYSFSGLSSKTVSYFVGLDAEDETNHPQAFLVGDDNFSFHGVPVKSGLLELSTNIAPYWQNVPIDWTDRRHKQQTGNIGLTDGSVHEIYYYSLRVKLFETGLATNRFAIP